MKKNFIIALVLLSVGIFILLWAPPVFAQVLARASGSVTTDKGVPIEGARIILVSSQDGAKVELTTNEKGEWKLVNLHPGRWTIGIMADGYQPQKINVVLSVLKEHPPIDIIMKPIPKHPLSKGNELYQAKKYAEALQEYQKVLAENQDMHQAHERIGLCYFRLGDLDKAIKAFKMMLDKEPQARNVLLNLSAILLEKGNLEEGMKYFKQLDEETITDHSMFYNIGVLLFAREQMEPAIDYFKKCTARNPNYVEAYYQMALAYLNQGNMEEAKKNFQKIIELAPESDKAAQAKEIINSLQ
ncbi:MAG: tetratricopeptide repeat protein [Candidatus Aminicenantes bacterium]|jgi:tetratricopeptide (TPR) repeat protein